MSTTCTLLSCGKPFFFHNLLIPSQIQVFTPRLLAFLRAWHELLQRSAGSILLSCKGKTSVLTVRGPGTIITASLRETHQLSGNCSNTNHSKTGLVWSLFCGCKASLEAGAISTFRCQSEVSWAELASGALRACTFLVFGASQRRQRTNLTNLRNRTNPSVAPLPASPPSEA